MAPSTRPVTKSKKSTAKAPIKHTSGIEKKVAPAKKTTTTKKAAAKAAKEPTKENVVKKETAKKRTSKQTTTKKEPAKNSAAKKNSKKAATKTVDPIPELPPVQESYYEADRREHGTYLSCGKGSLFQAHFPSLPYDPDITAAARLNKQLKTKKANLNYDCVTRNAATMVSRVLDDVLETITHGPIGGEPSLKSVVNNINEARLQLGKFSDPDRRHVNPNPAGNLGGDYNEGDGVGNWIVFKPSWYAKGRFELGDRIPFDSSLIGLKAEGVCVTVLE